MESSNAHPREAGTGGWVLETNGSSRAQDGGVGIVLWTLDGPTITQAIKLNFVVSNYEAEYEAVIIGLGW